MSEATHTHTVVIPLSVEPRDGRRAMVTPGVLALERQPSIVEAILDGRQPERMTLPVLMKPFPVAWGRQQDLRRSPSPPPSNPLTRLTFDEFCHADCVGAVGFELLCLGQVTDAEVDARKCGNRAAIIGMFLHGLTSRTMA